MSPEIRPIKMHLPSWPRFITGGGLSYGATPHTNAHAAKVAMEDWGGFIMILGMFLAMTSYLDGEVINCSLQNRIKQCQKKQALA